MVIGHFQLRELFIPVENWLHNLQENASIATKSCRNRQKTVHCKSCLTLIFFYYEENSR